MHAAWLWSGFILSLLQCEHAANIKTCLDSARSVDLVFVRLLALHWKAF